MSALKDSLYKILNDLNKIESAQKEQIDLSTYSSIIKRKLNEINNFIDTWKYDLIKNNKNRSDRLNLAPVKYVCSIAK